MSDYADLVARLKSVNSTEAPYANDLVREWCHEAAAAIEALVRERDDAEDRAERLVTLLDGEGAARKAAVRERDELLAALKDMRENRNGWQQRCADAEQKLYRTEQPAMPDIASAALSNKGGRDE